MGSSRANYSILLLFFVAFYGIYRCCAIDTNQTASLFVNASKVYARKMSDNLFGLFFEEINHAGAGRLCGQQQRF